MEPFCSRCQRKHDGVCGTPQPAAVRRTRIVWTDLSWHTWVRWSNWTFGVRVEWLTWIRHVVVEFGPLGLSLEIGEDFVDDTK